MIPAGHNMKKQSPSRKKPRAKKSSADEGFIIAEGVAQNNLKNIRVKIPLGKLTVVTGVSGSGKSSLAFDTIYAEGQRRYVETFSAYTRQFLDRMDKPRVNRVSGIPPAVAIDAVNPVRTSRSTVGTMTEISDYLKLLFSRAARLYCASCGKPVRNDTPESVAAALREETAKSPAGLVVTFSLAVPQKTTAASLREILATQGYTRYYSESANHLEIIQDRLVFDPGSAEDSSRLAEDLEAAFRFGKGRLSVHILGEDRKTAVKTLKFSSGLHCAACDIHYRQPSAGTFSFNSPVGACPKCRGFGRVIDFDIGLVIPDQNKTLAAGAVKPWQTASFAECQEDLEKYARRRGVPLDVPWKDLGVRHKAWVIEGEGSWDDGKWYGIRRFFDWLEKKSYKMHIRVLLSKYRAYRICPECGGSRLKPEALLWRVGEPPEALSIKDITALPIGGCLGFFSRLKLAPEDMQTTQTVLEGIISRLHYLVDVGLSYLTLDRQSRTLSGGEVQRINLTTALGVSLVNTLFVLDEPSIGLHSRDIRRLITILHRLRDAGNTLLVVEHDPELIRAADHFIDMGPGPGEKGGSIVFSGGIRELLSSRKSLTARFLTGDIHVGEVSPLAPAEAASAPPLSGGNPPATPPEAAVSRKLVLHGAGENNLKHIDLNLPLGRFVCLTGVSGSGKSTLVEDILYRALRRIKGQAAETPGAYEKITGHQFIHDVIMIDQSPLGRTARSNPASYSGAMSGIRKAFAASEEARSRGLTAGDFSFNSGAGRCPVCGGSGFEHIEMQFLSDVYLRCPDCDGRRYRPEILEIRIGGAHPKFSPASIADVLDMTVSEACSFFRDKPDIISALSILNDVGLGYLKLGQSVPTLSGGEAQRLKLASYLAGAADGSQPKGPASGNLFLLDEPTTGLHFADIAILLKVFRRLTGAGHSLLVIEHNLDVIAAADWIIDLGPEGGEEGGSVIAEGTPLQFVEDFPGHTAAALRRYTEYPAVAEQQPVLRLPPAEAITLRGAREHNLKNISLEIPRDTFTVITGVSGSGKSTIAFDILFAEGQRRYLESVGAYARQFVQPAARPDIDEAVGIPPTVAIEQRTSRGGRKSTVATVTEIYHFLRLLYVKLGVQHCPDCGIPIRPQTRDSIAARLMRDYRGQTLTILAPLINSRKGVYKDLAKQAAAKGYTRLRVDGEYLPTEPWPKLDRYKEHSIDLPLADVPINPGNEKQLRGVLDAALETGKGVISIIPVSGSAAVPVIFSTLRACPGCGRGFPEPDPRLFSYNSKHGWCPSCYGTGLRLAGFDEEQSGEEIWWNDWYEGAEIPCPECGGRRLNKEALAVTFDGLSIADTCALTVVGATARFDALRLPPREAEIAKDIIKEIQGRLAFLSEVGLSYLCLDRAVPTLSGGEARRIRLASQLGSNLRGVCYILDEPTIGLHPRDNAMLLESLEKLKKKGNSIVVVEHDEETIRRADHIIDIGPGGGSGGGQLIAQGSIADILKNTVSKTAACLRQPMSHPLFARRRPVSAAGEGPLGSLKITRACLHNLKNVDAAFPLGALVCVTGVSGSGKSTLVSDILLPNLCSLVPRRKGPKNLTGCGSLEGWENLRRVLEVDQSPIGKTPRSCPATYVGFWDDIRRLLAETPEARVRGYTPSRFSFNTPEGRCPDCEGQGMRKIEMSFLPDVTVLCETCAGRRFEPETCEITFKGKSAADILRFSAEEACEFFSFHPKIHHALSLLCDVGLGYISLGQQSPSLSGGEAQRIKLVSELARIRPELRVRGGENQQAGALYILDEPTIGLHMADVEKLIRVLHRLVDAGNTIILIEHNLDIIAEADWVIDMGPEGGEGGGRIIAAGSPEKLIRRKSHTARYLREFLERG
ncbi:MAG: excinuclease ABC subunit UvrA [Spirochaetales bacterium]|jgi:excinuclease ABC subunit A|nr:excinuclease ABC subunit UvrA [Spirochaetales bacterium]